MRRRLPGLRCPLRHPTPDGRGPRSFAVPCRGERLEVDGEHRPVRARARHRPRGPRLIRVPSGEPSAKRGGAPVVPGQGVSPRRLRRRTPPRQRLLRCGTSSPAARTYATVSPTGTSCPSVAQIPASTPSAGASTSTVTLSVSISRSGSPLATSSPSALSQRRIRPVSWASSKAGMMTSVATRAARRTPRPRRRRRWGCSGWTAPPEYRAAFRQRSEGLRPRPAAPRPGSA